MDLSVPNFTKIGSGVSSCMCDLVHPVYPDKT